MISRDYIVFILIVALVIMYSIYKDKENFEDVYEVSDISSSTTNTVQSSPAVEVSSGTTNTVQSSNKPPVIYCPINSSYENDKCNTKKCDSGYKYSSDMKKCLEQGVKVNTMTVNTNVSCPSSYPTRVENTNKCRKNPSNNSLTCGNQLYSSKIICYKNILDPIVKDPIKVCDIGYMLENGNCIPDIPAQPQYVEPREVILNLIECEKVLLLTYNKINNVPQTKFNYTFVITDNKFEPIELSPNTSIDLTSIFYPNKCYVKENDSSFSKEISALSIIDNNIFGVDTDYKVVNLPTRVMDNEENRNIFNNVLIYSNKDNIISKGRGEYLSINNGKLEFTNDRFKANKFTIIKVDSSFNINNIISKL